MPWQAIPGTGPTAEGTEAIFPCPTIVHRTAQLTRGAIFAEGIGCFTVGNFEARHDGPLGRPDRHPCVPPRGSMATAGGPTRPHREQREPQLSPGIERRSEFASRPGAGPAVRRRRLPPAPGREPRSGRRPRESSGAIPGPHAGFVGRDGGGTAAVSHADSYDYANVL
jgi:hypothetical protein